MKIYDAENQILGRLSSVVAKELLSGEKILIVNSEKAVLSGNPKSKTSHYSIRVKRGDRFKGPFFPREPSEIVRRTIRGMIPWHKPKGRAAFSNLKVIIGVPEEVKDQKFVKVDNANVDKLKIKYITLGEISAALGAKKRW